MNTKLYSSTSVDFTVETVHIAFTGKAAGNLGLHVGDNPLSVLRNRINLEEELGLTAGSFAYINQVHGIAIARFAASNRRNTAISHEAAKQELGSAPTADAAISVTGRPLAVLVADCLPIVFLATRNDSERPISAVAHAGRQGLLDGVIEEVLNQLEFEGATEIRAWIGPSICGQCYEVPAELQEASEQIVSGISSTTSWGTPALDLPGAAHKKLLAHPLVQQVCMENWACTLETDTVFSHRRRDMGRIAGLIWRQKNDA